MTANSTIPNWIPELEAKSVAELVAIREDITTRAKGKPADLPIEELEKLCAVFELLRRKHSGPPKSKSSAPAAKVDISTANF